MEEPKSAAPQNQFTLNAPLLSLVNQKWAIKILVIIIALLAFQIPLHMVRELTVERKKNADAVRIDIAKTWGGEQTVKLLPAAAVENITAEVTPEIRYRGIYQTVVYTSKIKINAEYQLILT